MCTLRVILVSKLLYFLKNNVDSLGDLSLFHPECEPQHHSKISGSAQLNLELGVIPLFDTKSTVAGRHESICPTCWAACKKGQF